MNHEKPDPETNFLDGPHAEEISFLGLKINTYLAIGLLSVFSYIFLFAKLGTFGLWEPWESDLIRLSYETLANQPSSSGNISTFSQWIIVSFTDLSEAIQVGTFETAVRAPVAALGFVFLVGVFWQVRDSFGNYPAVVTGLVFLTLPLTMFGVRCISSDFLFVVLSSGAIASGFEFVQPDHSSISRYILAILFSLLIGICFWEYRFFGLAYPFAVLVAYGIWSRFRRTTNNGGATFDRTDYFVLGLISLICVVLFYMYFEPSAKFVDLLEGNTERWILPTLCGLLLFAGGWITRKTPETRVFWGVPGLVVVLLTAALVFVVYQFQAPETAAKLLVFTPAGEMADKLTQFAYWVRKTGFALFPWVCLLPIGLSYAIYHIQSPEGSESPPGRKECLLALAVLWFFVALIFTPVLGYFEPTNYLGAYPVALCVGICVTDDRFWRYLRDKSLLPKIAGVVSVAVIFMFFKDFERFPDRMLEAFIPAADVIELGDSFEYGSAFKILKYAWTLLLLAFFFRGLSWMYLRARDIWNIRAGFNRWLRRWRRQASLSPLTKKRSNVAEDPSQEVERRKSSLRSESEGWAVGLVRGLESARFWSIAVTLFAMVTSGIVLFHYGHSLNSEFTRRAIYETYIDERNGEDAPLYHYDVSGQADSIYLSSAESIANIDDFVSKYDQESRIFLALPSDKLAEINHEIRRKYGENIPVLTEKSSELLLVSNRKSKTEPDHNFVAPAIFESRGEANIQFPLQYSHRGRLTRASFDRKLELLGYSLDRVGKNGRVPTYRWGESVELTTFFEVTGEIRRDYEIFMHVDTSGNRIHGDHKPWHGDFPTRYWLEGDIVKDTYELEIPPYSAGGLYTIYFGFYQGSDRMSVHPDQAHDGGNRLILGKFRVKSGFLN